MIHGIIIVLALLFAVFMVMICLSARGLAAKMSDDTLVAERRLREKKTTEFLDRNKVDDTCDICFGEFENGKVAVSKCGMKFHEECASMTGECPYCKERFETMELRDIRVITCPCCGERVAKNVCPNCGTVIPNRDMRFECVCGSTVYAGDGFCKDCGATFEFTYDAPDKRT